MSKPGNLSELFPYIFTDQKSVSSLESVGSLESVSSFSSLVALFVKDLEAINESLEEAFVSAKTNEIIESIKIDDSKDLKIQRLGLIIDIAKSKIPENIKPTLVEQIVEKFKDYSLRKPFEEKVNEDTTLSNETKKVLLDATGNAFQSLKNDDLVEKITRIDNALKIINEREGSPDKKNEDIEIYVKHIPKLLELNDDRPKTVNELLYDELKQSVELMKYLNKEQKETVNQSIDEKFNRKYKKTESSQKKHSSSKFKADKQSANKKYINPVEKYSAFKSDDKNKESPNKTNQVQAEENQQDEPRKKEPRKKLLGFRNKITRLFKKSSPKYEKFHDNSQSSYDEERPPEITSNETLEGESKPNDWQERVEITSNETLERESKPNDWQERVEKTTTSSQKSVSSESSNGWDSTYSSSQRSSSSSSTRSI